MRHLLTHLLTRRLTYILLIGALSLSAHNLFAHSLFAHGQILEDFSIPLEEDPIEFGRWIKLGTPVKEFPVCYQVWKCDKSHLDDPTILRDSLPVGEWGVCENYLEPDPKNPNLCTECNVSAPNRACY